MVEPVVVVALSPRHLGVGHEMLNDNPISARTFQLRQHFRF
jgi:hypothetical protein